MSDDDVMTAWWGGAPVRAVLARALETRAIVYPEQRVLAASRAENRGTNSQRLTAIAARNVYPGWNGFPFLQASRA